MTWFYDSARKSDYHCVGIICRVIFIIITLRLPDYFSTEIAQHKSHFLWATISPVICVISKCPATAPATARTKSVHQDTWSWASYQPCLGSATTDQRTNINFIFCINYCELSVGLSHNPGWHAILQSHLYFWWWLSRSQILVYTTPPPLHLHSTTRPRIVF